MGREPSERALQIFRVALDRPPDEQQAVLAEACAGDVALRAEVERLLAADATQTFLQPPDRTCVVGPIAPDPDDGLVGREIGRYRIVRRIASGGMGTVYEALQPKPRRSVALKIVRADLASESALRRFVHEAEILARLRHPAIAQVYEAGSHAGMPYFAMEYIPSAQTLIEFAEDHKLPTRRRLEMFAEICDAIHHGHQRGVIHRDLKPGNILVDEAGRPKVIDFGVARATDADVTIATLQTDVGQVVGTLRYMSPEQCEGDSAALDTRSDVYALGVVLYELLTGRFPYDVTNHSPFEIPQIIRECAPRRPSSISRLLRGDVETIVLKALEKDRTRRYQSASELAADIRRYLHGQPIEARSDSRFYMLRKQVQRYRIPLAVASGFVLLLIGSSIVAWTLYFQSQQRLWESYLSQAHARRWSGKPGCRVESLTALRKAAAIRPSAALRDEAIACMALVDAEFTNRIDYSSLDPAPNVAADPDVQRVMLWWNTGETLLKRVADNREVLSLAAQGGFRARPLPRFSADGKYLARPGESACEIWEIDPARLIDTFAVRATDYLQPLDFSRDSCEVAVGAADGSVAIHSLRTGETHTLPPVHAPVHRIHYSPAVDTLATCSLSSSDVLLRDANSGEVLQVLEHPAAVRTVAWSKDGRQMASACSDQCAYVWDLGTTQKRWTLHGHTGPVTAIGFGCDDTILYTASWDGTTLLWDPRLGRRLLTLQGCGLGFASAGPWLGLRTFQPGLAFVRARVYGNDAFRTICDHPAESQDGCQWVRVSPDGRLAATASGAGVRLWDLEHNRAVAYLPIGFTNSVVFQPDGLALITVAPRRILRWPLRIDDQVLHVGPPESIVLDTLGNFWEACLSADGNKLAVSADLRRVVVADLDHPADVRIFEPHVGVCSVALSPDGRWLATGAWKGSDAKVWDVASGEVVHVVPTSDNVRAGFSPDGKWLVTSEAEYVLWEVGTWRPVARFPRGGYTSVSAAASFSDDGTYVAAISDASKIDLIHLGRCAVVARLECPLQLNMIGVSCTPDGTRVIFPGRAGHILHVWDLPVVRERLATMGLDWEAPPFPAPAAPASARPLRAELYLGKLEPPGDRGQSN